MDLERIESVLELMREYSVSDFEYESEGARLRLCLGSVTTMVAAPAPVVAQAAPAAGAPAAQEAPTEEGDFVKSPIVGTFYRAAKPGAPPYVEVGDKVKKGQVLCIIEAMKLMNELEAEEDGTIAAILVDNAQPVQFGHELFRIIPG